MATQFIPPPVIPVVPQVYDVNAESRALIGGYEAGTRSSAIAADIWKSQQNARLAEERANLQLAAQLQQLELKEAAMALQASQREAQMALQAQQFQDKLAFEAEKAQLGALQKGLDRASREDIAGMGIASREGIAARGIASREDIASLNRESREGIAGMQIEGRRTLQQEYIDWQKGRPGEKVKNLQGMAMQAYSDELQKVGNDPRALAALQSKYGPLMGVGGGAATPDALAKLAEYTDLYSATARSPELEQRVGASLSQFQAARKSRSDAEMDYQVAMAEKAALDNASGVTIIDRQKAYAKALEAQQKLAAERRIWGDTNMPVAPSHPGPALKLTPGLTPPPQSWLGPTGNVNRVNLDLSATFGTNSPNAVTTLYLGNTNAATDSRKFGDWIEVRQ